MTTPPGEFEGPGWRKRLDRALTEMRRAEAKPETTPISVTKSTKVAEGSRKERQAAQVRSKAVRLSGGCLLYHFPSPARRSRRPQDRHG